MTSKPVQPKTAEKLSAQDSKVAIHAPEHTTVIIRHPVSATAEFLFGTNPGFPNTGVFPNPLLFQRVILTLQTRGVQVFSDGLPHGEIHPLAAYDLLASGSRADLDRQGLLRLETKPGQSQLIVLHGIRWEVSPRFSEIRIFGSSSSPDEVLLIDLVKPESEVSQ